MKRCALATMRVEFSLYHSVGVLVSVVLLCRSGRFVFHINIFLIHNTVERRSCYRCLSLINGLAGVHELVSC